MPQLLSICCDSCNNFPAILLTDKTRDPKQYHAGYHRVRQELSYLKQIARQLRTHYIEGIYRAKYYMVTLKSRLRVTQGHWKRKHWKDHT